ncbi:hypothetical protein [Variovorax sp. 770b2]|uniref:hypothetical protein n=1 Tax=Variovorax sp. 770b2 TaxID=1566271 RepID=UPI0008E6DA69|nr:hypothetical protein [Variovorax sp. 770b2]SFQ04738.1 hypothetical protein SAMN03159339_5302 [Variovorax sp. 770b2]
MSATTIFDRICRPYDGFSQVVEQLDLPAQEGEYPSLLRPAGSDKTTALMLQAGIETPAGAEIRLIGGSLRTASTHTRGLPNAAPNASPRFFEDTSPTLLPKFVSWPFE